MHVLGHFSSSLKVNEATVSGERNGESASHLQDNFRTVACVWLRKSCWGKALEIWGCEKMTCLCWGIGKNENCHGLPGRIWVGEGKGIEINLTHRLSEYQMLLLCSTPSFWCGVSWKGKRPHDCLVQSSHLPISAQMWKSFPSDHILYITQIIHMHFYICMCV